MAAYNMASTQSVLRAPSYALFIIMIVFDCFVEVCSQLYEFFKIRMYDEMTLLDRNAPYTNNEARPRRLGSVAPDEFEHHPTKREKVLQSVPVHTSPVVSTSSVYMAWWTKYSTRYLNEEEYRMERAIIERHYRRFAVNARYASTATLVALTAGFVYDALLISPQPFYEQCNGLWYLPLDELAARYGVALGVIVGVYTILYSYLRFFTKAPLSFAKTVPLDFTQGILNTAVNCMAISTVLYAYEVGLLDNFVCGNDKMVPF